MTNHVSIKIEDDDQYEHLQEVKDRYGLTWKGLLVQGSQSVVQRDPMQATKCEGEE